MSASGFLAWRPRDIHPEKGLEENMVSKFKHSMLFAIAKTLYQFQNVYQTK